MRRARRHLGRTPFGRHRRRPDHRDRSRAAMTSTLVTGISELTTWEPDRPVRHDAAIVFEAGAVAWVGDAADAPAADERIDATGRAAVPGFVDSHSHLMF